MTILLILCLTSVLAAAVPAATPYPLKRYVSERPPFTVFRPDTWKVRYENAPDYFRIWVSDAEAASAVEIFFGDNRQNRFDALRLLRAKSLELRARHPDLRISEVQACKDNSCAAATLSYTRDRVPVAGRFYFQTDPQQIIIRSYLSPAARLAAQRNLMLTILANIRLGGPQAARQTQAPAAPTPAPPVRVQLVPRHAPDGSFAINLPQDWSLQGLKGRVLAVDPQGGCGFIFTVFEFLPSNPGVPLGPSVLISPYRQPSQAIQAIFQKFGNRNTRVLGVAQDAQTRAQCQCEADDMVLSWVSPKGVPTMGGFKVINSRPNFIGHWFSIVAGMWGPEQSLASHLPMLEQIASSFAINDRFARAYVQQGLAQLRAQQQRTARAMQDLNDARAQNQRDWEARQERRDASNAKWDDYRRGNSYWISELEGGKIYATDPWGTKDTWTGDRVDGAPYNYIHFEGQNPRHPSENMRELSSYEVEKITGGR